MASMAQGRFYKEGMIPEGHPEHSCQRCGDRNIGWYAPNDLWNDVIGSGDGIICPECFHAIAKDKGIKIYFSAERIRS